MKIDEYVDPDVWKRHRSDPDYEDYSDEDLREMILECTVLGYNCSASEDCDEDSCGCLHMIYND